MLRVSCVEWIINHRTTKTSKFSQDESLGRDVMSWRGGSEHSTDLVARAWHVAGVSTRGRDVAGVSTRGRVAWRDVAGVYTRGRNAWRDVAGVYTRGRNTWRGGREHARA